MAGSITVTSKQSFTDQSGDLTFIHPNRTVRPVGHWSVLRWWNKGKTAIYEGCARVDNTATNETIYIASSTDFPRLKIEWDGTSYQFDSESNRENINRILVTNHPFNFTGDDYVVPLRDTATVKIHKA